MCDISCVLTMSFFNQFPFLVRARLASLRTLRFPSAFWERYISAFFQFHTLLHNSFMWQLRIEIKIYVLDAWILSVMYATLTSKVSSVHFADNFGFWLRNQNILSIWLSCVIAARQSVAFVVVSFYLSPLLLATRQETFKTPVAHTTTEVQRKTEEITSACCISEKKNILFGAFCGDSGDGILSPSLDSLKKIA